ncbi:MAG: hypothetical protein JNJ96_01125 [Anaerolineales bacterium]|nr:hypothetical protein [Anaerolineales bacterium]
MTTPTLETVSELAIEIKKLISETEPLLLKNDDGFIDKKFDDDPPWAGEWNDQVPPPSPPSPP